MTVTRGSQRPRHPKPKPGTRRMAIVDGKRITVHIISPKVPAAISLPAEPPEWLKHTPPVVGDFYPPQPTMIELMAEAYGLDKKADQLERTPLPPDDEQQRYVNVTTEEARQYELDRRQSIAPPLSPDYARVEDLSGGRWVGGGAPEEAPCTECDAAVVVTYLV